MIRAIRYGRIVGVFLVITLLSTTMRNQFANLPINQDSLRSNTRHVGNEAIPPLPDGSFPAAPLINAPAPASGASAAPQKLVPKSGKWDAQFGPSREMGGPYATVPLPKMKFQGVGPYGFALSLAAGKA